MKYFWVTLAIILLLYLLDKICLRLEKKGLLYYRKHKPSTGGLMGSMLLEMQKIFNPSTQHVIEMKQNKEVKQSKNQLRFNMSNDIYVEENVPLFEAIYGKGLISLGGFEAINKMFSRSDLKGKQILDVGSGIGGMAYYLAEQYHCKVIGLEIHPWMANYATTHAPKNIKNNLKFISYPPDGSIPITDGSIDICCSKGVLTNVEKKLELFQELHRILNNKGQIVFIDWLVPESSGPKYDRLRLGDMSFKETQSSYTQILEKAGFNHIQFIDKSKEYLQYVKQLDKMYHSLEHKKAYANIISESLREALILANRDLKKSIESGQQLSMLIQADK